MRAHIVHWKHLRALTPEPSVIVTLDGEFPYEELSHYTIEPDPYHQWMAYVHSEPAALDVDHEVTPAYFIDKAAQARQWPYVEKRGKPRSVASTRWSIACHEAFAIMMERIARGGTTYDHEYNRFCLRQQELAEHFNICPWDGQYTVHGFRHEHWKKISWLS